MGQLNSKRVNASKDRGKHADRDGLNLNVKSTGAKCWILRVMVNGRRQEIGLGGLSLLSLADARIKTARLRAEAKQGWDPRAAGDHRETIFEDAVRAMKRGKKWDRSPELYAFPRVCDRPVGIGMA